MSVVEAAVATGLVVVAPGPALAMSVSSAIDGGRRAGFLAIAGLAAGILLHAAAAAVGLAVLFAADDRLVTALQAAGALFLVIVGIRMIARSRAAARPKPREARRTPYLARGLVTNVLNPWILGFYLTMLPVLSDGSAIPVLPAAAVAGVHVAQLAVWHGVWVIALSSVATTYGSTARALRLAAGAALVATGVWFMFR